MTHQPLAVCSLFNPRAISPMFPHGYGRFNSPLNLQRASLYRRVCHGVF